MNSSVVTLDEKLRRRNQRTEFSPNMDDYFATSAEVIIVDNGQLQGLVRGAFPNKQQLRPRSCCYDDYSYVLVKRQFRVTRCPEGLLVEVVDIEPDYLECPQPKYLPYYVGPEVKFVRSGMRVIPIVSA